MKTKVVFVHRNGLSGSGSKIMRCDQLSEICKRHLGDMFEFSVRTQRPIRNSRDLKRACSELENSVVILLKGTAKLFGEEGMAQLRSNARGVCIDYVDADVYASYSKWAQVHIGASLEGCRLLNDVLAAKENKAKDARVMHLAHHVDPRLLGKTCRATTGVRTCYLGNPANVHLPSAVRHRVTMLSYSRDKTISEIFGSLMDFNMHYCVRSVAPPADQKRVAKPFTKGFTAAAVGAHIITTRDADDALDYLGEDYPFLLERATLEQIAAALDCAESMFGTPAWDDARERLSHLREMSSPQNVAGEMKKILSVFC